MFSVGAKAGRTILPAIKKGGIVISYFVVSGILFMFAEGFRDVGRTHFRDIVYTIIKKPDDEEGDKNE